MEIHEIENGKVEFNPEIPAIIWTAKGFMHSNEFRELTMKGVEAFIENKKQNPNICWLNDVRKMKVISGADQTWLNTKINDEVEKQGLRKLAMVLPENIFAKMAQLYTEVALKRHKNNLEIKSFKEYNKAVEWLKNAAYELSN